MSAKPAIRSRTIKGWCVVNERGVPLLNTVRPKRSRAIIAFTQSADPAEWKHLRLSYGVQVVRLTITTEP